MHAGQVASSKFLAVSPDSPQRGDVITCRLRIALHSGTCSSFGFSVSPFCCAGGAGGAGALVVSISVVGLLCLGMGGLVDRGGEHGVGPRLRLV